MRFLVAHSTLYRYEAPVTLGPHILRLQPRCDGSQKLWRFDLEIRPRPAGRSACLDQDGNAVTQVWFEGLTDRLLVESRFEAEPLRENPFDFLLPPADALALPLSYGEPWRTLLLPYANNHAMPAPVAEFARNVERESGPSAMPFLDALTRRLFEEWTPTERLEGEAYPAETTLATREASCRDLAALFCHTCRAVGLAARFVSGYESASAGHDRPTMHAWAEVYIPGAGWRGFDPSRGLAVSTGHIAVAAAAEPALAAPFSGTYHGAARAATEVSLQIQVQT
jgi:transglutaminase-like putative cysteine protease